MHYFCENIKFHVDISNDVMYGQVQTRNHTLNNSTIIWGFSSCYINSFSSIVIYRFIESFNNQQWL